MISNQRVSRTHCKTDPPDCPADILCVNFGAKVMLSDFGLATSDPVSRDFGCGSSYYMSPGKLVVCCASIDDLIEVI